MSLALRISGRVAQALKAEAISSMGDELFNAILRMLCVGVHSTALTQSITPTQTLR